LLTDIHRDVQGAEEDNLVDVTLCEQDTIWSRGGKPQDVLICLGSKASTEHLTKSREFPGRYLRVQDLRDHVSFCAGFLLSSMFFLELIGLPILNNAGLSCRAQIRCRILPSDTSCFVALLKLLWNNNASFCYDDQTIQCVDKGLYEQGITSMMPFSRYIEFSARSLADSIDIKIIGLTEKPRSISNCPYILQDLLEDQGLNCVFGHRDHRAIFIP
jgi:hypothetical protein